MIKTPFTACVTKVFGSKFAAQKRGKSLTYSVPAAKLRELLPHFKTPACQAELDPSRVAEIHASYVRNPEYIAFKNTIVLAAVCDAIYTVDGQHRLKMVEQHDVDEDFNVVVFNITSDAQMNALFTEVNKDSLKNAGFVSLGIDAQQRSAELGEVLATKYSSLFASEKKTKTDRVRTIRSFLAELNKTAYLGQFGSVDELVADLDKANDEFCRTLTVPESAIYSVEQGAFKEKFMPPLVHCNFTEFLNDRSVSPSYEGKQKRDAVSAKDRKEVWKNEFKGALEGKCPIGCGVLLVRDEKNGWDCGHVVSHKNGGREDVSNLRPICKNCNGKMGTQNWDEYVPKKSWFQF